MKAVFLLFVSILFTISLNDDLLLSDCCYKKKVGGEEYIQVPGNTKDFNCKEECVYEKVGAKGSRYCFAGGKLQVKCKSTQPRFSNVQHIYAIQENGIVDWMSFSTDIGVLYCEVGTTFNVSLAVDIQCILKPGDSSTTMKPSFGQGRIQIMDEMASFIVAESENGLDWLIIHFELGTVYCSNTDSSLMACTLDQGRLYRGKVITQNSAPGIDSQEKCKELCDNPNTVCTFWTFSDINNKPSHERNHAGISECGIRTYSPNYLISTSRGQNCGKKNGETKEGKVYVERVKKVENSEKCNQFCLSTWRGEATWLYCKSWTFNFVDNICVLNFYYPDRVISIYPPGFVGPSFIVSEILFNCC